MKIEYRLLTPDDREVLDRIAPDVFDYPVDERLCTEFLDDPRHHLAVAIDRRVVVGFVSAVSYIHPDKSVELWINEAGVAPTHQRQGVAKKLFELLFDAGRQLGCRTAWVLTERSNEAAMRLYQSSGGIEDPEDTVMFSFELER